MFKSVLRIVAPASKAPLATMLSVTRPKITIYHNTASPISHHLLRKLNAYNKFVIDCKTDVPVSYSDYHYMLSLCLNVHPSNAVAFETIFPSLVKSNHSFDAKSAKVNNKHRAFVTDHDVVAEQDFHSRRAPVPVVIDWSNHLIAINDDGLDRIMANYLTCGIQSSKDVYDPFINHPTNKYGQHVIHPHVAEFADLF